MKKYLSISVFILSVNVLFAQSEKTKDSTSGITYEKTKISMSDFAQKYQSGRALEIHYIDVSAHTDSDIITIGDKKYKFYQTRKEAVDEFINAHLKRDLTIVYVKKKEGQEYKENPEYFEITE